MAYNSAVGTIDVGCITHMMCMHVQYRVFQKKWTMVWTGNTLMVICKLSLSSDMLVKAYSKPRVYYQSIQL